MEATALEVITISESENDATGNEEYLRIYYPSTSSTAEEEKDCIEVPVDNKNGSLLFSDIKALDPNIFALNLTRNKVSRLLKPTNGCFKEPKEKWSSFKIVAVLKDSTNDSYSTTTTSNNNDSTRKTSTALELRLPSCSTPAVAPTTRIPFTSKQVLCHNEKRATPFTLSSSINNVSTRTISSNEIQLPTAFTADGTLINNEQSKSTTVSAANQLRQASSTSAQNKSAATNAPNTVPPPQVIDPSPPSSSLHSNITSVNTNQSLSSSHENITEVTNAEILKAYNVSSYFELRDLLCQGDSKYYDCYTFIFDHLKRTLITHPDKDIVKLLYYAYRSWFDLQTLDPNAPDTCDICDLSLTISHVVSKGHIIKYQSKHNKDPPEISLILDFKNRAQIITYSLLVKNGENPFDFFINKFYPKIQFETFKNNLVYRITTAHLKLSFEDPLLFEKLLFLSENVDQHPNLKDIFSENYFCKNCDILLLGVSSIVYHLFTELHMCTSLTQNQLNKLIEAVSIVDYSADDRSRKRDLQETAAETSVKHQRRTFYF